MGRESKVGKTTGAIMTRVVKRKLWGVLALACAGSGFGAAAIAGWSLGPFRRPPSGNPVMRPRAESVFTDPITHQPVHWESLHTFNPAAIARNGKVCLLYRAEDNTGDMLIGGHTSRIGLAESSDGIHFTRRPEPVLFPADDDQKDREWPGGCEDPRIVESPDGGYVLTYTQWNRKTYDAGIATSRDLITWTKHGPMLAKAKGGKYAALQYKSAAIVTRRAGERLVAARIQDSYWMFWDEGSLHLARSKNLIDWDPVEDEHGELLNVLGPRPGRFDSSFPEAGPPPLLTDRGIVVIYNGKNAPQGGAPDLAPNAYAAGQALFAGDNPAQLIARLEGPFFKPAISFERSGQYAAGTTFTEGLVWFQNRWFLYYGAADSLVGVAVSPASK